MYKKKIFIKILSVLLIASFINLSIFYEKKEAEALIPIAPILVDAGVSILVSAGATAAGIKYMEHVSRNEINKLSTTEIYELQNKNGVRKLTKSDYYTIMKKNAPANFRKGYVLKGAAKSGLIAGLVSVAISSVSYSIQYNSDQDYGSLSGIVKESVYDSNNYDRSLSEHGVVSPGGIQIVDFGAVKTNTVIGITYDSDAKFVSISVPEGDYPGTLFEFKYYNPDYFQYSYGYRWSDNGSLVYGFRDDPGRVMEIQINDYTSAWGGGSNYSWWVNPWMYAGNPGDMTFKEHTSGNPHFMVGDNQCGFYDRRYEITVIAGDTPCAYQTYGGKQVLNEYKYTGNYSSSSPVYWGNSGSQQSISNTQNLMKAVNNDNYIVVITELDDGEVIVETGQEAEDGSLIEEPNEQAEDTESYGGILGWLRQIWFKLAEILSAIRSIVGNLLAGIWDFISDILDGIGNLFADLKEFLGTQFDVLMDFNMELVQGLGSVFTVIIDFLVNLPYILADFVGDIIDAIGDISISPGGVVENLKGTIQDALSELFVPEESITVVLNDIKAVALTKAPFSWIGAFLESAQITYGDQPVVIAWTAGVHSGQDVNIVVPKQDKIRAFTTVLLTFIALFAAYNEVRRWIG